MRARVEKNSRCIYGSWDLESHPAVGIYNRCFFKMQFMKETSLSFHLIAEIIHSSTFRTNGIDTDESDLKPVVPTYAKTLNVIMVPRTQKGGIKPIEEISHFNIFCGWNDWLGIGSRFF